MPVHQKILTGILLVLTGMLLGVLLMVFRGKWMPPERVEVRYTDVVRSTEPIETLPGEEKHSPSGYSTDIAQKIIPSVVFIETDIILDQDSPDSERDPFENRFWDRFLPRRHAQSIGSGVLITRDGYILTNQHVIDGSDDRILVMTHDKKQYRARLVGSDPSTDLAVIKIDTKDAEPLVVGNSDHVQVGDRVMAVGNPFRLRSTVTAGIVSALGRDVDIIDDRMRIESFIQTDAAINRGNSGGALVNSRGELIGINTAIASESGTYQGYGFAVPVNLAMKIGQDIIEFGEARRAYLGVEIATVNYNTARRLGLDEVSGVEIRNLIAGGSASQGGLKKGDVVLKVNDHLTCEANHLQERIALMRPGETVEMEIWRDRRILNLEYSLMGEDNEVIREWASAEISGYHKFDFESDAESVVRKESFEAGFSLAELAVPKNLSRNELIVIRVLQGSRAANAGLMEEDVIIELNGQEMRDLDTFYTAWEKLANNNRQIRIEIMRDGERRSVEIEAP